MMRDATTLPGLTRLAALILVGAALVACRRDGEQDAVDAEPVQGAPIRTSGPDVTNSVRLGTGNLQASSEAGALNESFDGEFLRLGFETLSGFKYTVYEYYAEGVSGRPLLRSDDVIPAEIKRHDGKKVSIRGFVLPLRTKKGRVTEFLLLKDQGTCCFGPQAQINHFIRVNHPKGGEFTQGSPYRVTGTLRVGETYVQGYLTGIYQLEAETAEESFSAR